MRVDVCLFAHLSAYLPAGASGDSVTLDVPEATTVGRVIELLHIPPDLESLRVVNGRDAELDQPLSDGDVLTVFPPLAGG